MNEINKDLYFSVVPSWTNKRHWFYFIHHYPWKVRAIIRSGYSCKKCERKKRELQIYHLDQNSSNNDVDNLIVLCKKCLGEKTHPLNSQIYQAVKLCSTDNKINWGSLSDIAKRMEVSRERARQIMKKLGYKIIKTKRIDKKR